MENIDNVGRTAFIISNIRAAEDERPEPLFADPFARLFHHAQVAAATARYQQEAPFLTHNVRLRTVWFDRLVERELDAGTTQVVVLGAGFDSRALRFRRPDVVFFEVDRPEVLSYKAETLATAGHASPAIAVHADYGAPGTLLRELVAHGLDPAARTLVLWEGNTYYLPPALTRQVLRELAAGIRDVREAFDFFGSAVIEGRSRSPSMRLAIPILRGIGAPWQGGIDDPSALAAEVGLRVREHCDTAALHAGLAPHRLELGDDQHAEYGTCVLAN